MNDIERDHVIDRLSTEYARGAFEVEELEQRLALAHTAKSPSELDALVTDLAPWLTPPFARPPINEWAAEPTKIARA